MLTLWDHLIKVLWIPKYANQLHLVFLYFGWALWLILQDFMNWYLRDWASFSSWLFLRWFYSFPILCVLRNRLKWISFIFQFWKWSFQILNQVYLVKILFVFLESSKHFQLLRFFNLFLQGNPLSLFKYYPHFLSQYENSLLIWQKHVLNDQIYILRK